MEFAKFTGKTLDEALAAACDAKGCTKEELHYEVTEEKSGFLGIGKTIEIEAYCPKDIEDFIKSYIQTYFDNAELDGTVEIEKFISDKDMYNARELEILFKEFSD